MGYNFKLDDAEVSTFKVLVITTLTITEPSLFLKDSCLPELVKFLFVISWTLFSCYGIWPKDLILVHSILSFDIEICMWTKYLISLLANFIGTSALNFVDSIFSLSLPPPVTIILFHLPHLNHFQIFNTWPSKHTWNSSISSHLHWHLSNLNHHHFSLGLCKRASHWSPSFPFHANFTHPPIFLMATKMKF